MKFGVVILAAGASRRMGQPKLLLPWNGTTIIGHLAKQWTELEAEQIAVVLSKDNGSLKTELDRLNFPNESRITNPQPERGMFSSIQCAANWGGWDTSLTHSVVTLGDQPHLRLETLQSLIQFAGQNPEKICQPSFAGRPKHPVILPGLFFRQLSDANTKTFAEFLAKNSQHLGLKDSEDPRLNLDLDTPEDYAKAKNWTPSPEPCRRTGVAPVSDFGNRTFE